MKIDAQLQQAAYSFGLHQIDAVETLSNGLIHQTYKAGFQSTSILLQQINESVFKEPQKIIENYQLIYSHSLKHQFKIPTPIKCSTGDWTWRDDTGALWRAQEYIDNSYTELDLNTDKAYKAAKCFAEFTQTMADLDAQLINETIPKFHNVQWRYQQLQEALAQASSERIMYAKELLEKIDTRESLVDFFTQMQFDPDFKKRIMHHDCKLSNVLFNKYSHEPISPIDLDTTMPGYYFSDVGDMIRSMTATVDENSTDWNSIEIEETIYKALLDGYCSGIGNVFTKKENQCIHHAGLLMIFMQAVRFLSDYLVVDTYYKINYPEQNLNRAKNQLILLEKLEHFLKKEYQYSS